MYFVEVYGNESVMPNTYFFANYKDAIMSFINTYAGKGIICVIPTNAGDDVVLVQNDTETRVGQIDPMSKVRVYTEPTRF